MQIDWTQAPRWARYAAMDQNGTWMWYAHEPIQRSDCWQPACAGFESFNPCPVHWTQTLTERPTE